jgi:hypothetical protein
MILNSISLEEDKFGIAVKNEHNTAALGSEPGGQIQSRRTDAGS